MASSTVRWCALLAVVTLARAAPGPALSTEPLAAASELAQRLAAREPRLPLPSAQDLDNVKKVAQILVMLGEQRNNRNRANVEMFANMVDAMRRARPAAAHTPATHKVIPSLLGANPPAAAHTNPPPPAVEEVPNDPVHAK